MRLIGVKRELFEFQAAILEDALKEKHGDSGRPYKLTVEDTSPPIDVWLFKRLYTIPKTRNVGNCYF